MSKRTTKNRTSAGSGAEMKKLAVSGLLVGGFVVYTLAHGRANAVAIGDTAPTIPSPNTPASTAIPGTTPSAGASSGQYKDAAYTGSVADAQWGYVQVKVVVWADA